MVGNGWKRLEQRWKDVGRGLEKKRGGKGWKVVGKRVGKRLVRGWKCWKEVGGRWKGIGKFLE